MAVSQRFPHSLSPDLLFAHCCWEYVVQWNKDPEVHIHTYIHILFINISISFCVHDKYSSIRVNVNSHSKFVWLLDSVFAHFSCSAVSLDMTPFLFLLIWCILSLLAATSQFHQKEKRQVLFRLIQGTWMTKNQSSLFLNLDSHLLLVLGGPILMLGRGTFEAGLQSTYPTR